MRPAGARQPLGTTNVLAPVRALRGEMSPRSLTQPAAALIALAALGASVGCPQRALAADGVAVSMEQAVERVLVRHPALAAGRDAVDAAVARTSQTNTVWLPRIALQAGYQFTGPVPSLKIDTGLTPPGATSPLVVEKTLGSHHHASAVLKVAWLAWDFGRLARADAAEAMEDAARADVLVREVELAAGVRQAYLAARFFAELEASTAASLALARDQAGNIGTALEAGLGRKVDVAAADARVAELEARLVEAQQSRARALGSLRILLGLPATAALSLTDDLASVASTPTPTGPATHPQLHAVDERLRALDASDESMALNFWPRLDVVASVGVQFPEHFATDRGLGIPYLLGVNLTWDLFDRLLNNRQRDELGAQRAQAMHLRAAAAEELATAALDAATATRSAAASLAAARRRVEAAQVWLDAARGARDAGAGTVWDVRGAEEAVDQARLGELSARFEAARARVAALQAAGVIHVPAAAEDTPPAAQGSP